MPAKYTFEWWQRNRHKPSRHIGDDDLPRPARVTLSLARMARLDPMFTRFGRGSLRLVQLLKRFAFFDPMCIYAEYAYHGTAEPALVVSVTPLIVAAYSYEFDWVVQFQFPPPYSRAAALFPGKRLLAVNMTKPGRPSGDLIFGPGQVDGESGDFHPIIADFVTDDDLNVEQRKAEITDGMWHRAAVCMRAYQAAFGFHAAREYGTFSSTPLFVSRHQQQTARELASRMLRPQMAPDAVEVELVE